MRTIREAIGLSRKKMAQAIGVQDNYYNAMEDGKYAPSYEVRERFKAWAFKRINWSQNPTMPARPRKPKLHKVMTMHLYDKDLYRQWELAAASVGTSMSAFAEEAIRRLVNDEPTIVSIRQAIQAAERMREKMILDANPDIVEFLAGDPMLAKMIHRTEEVQILPARPRQDPLLNFDPRNDGAAMEAQIQPWTRPAKKT